MIVQGHCSFGDKCQYSHAGQPRRNPQKVKYCGTMCTNGACAKGEECPYAHTVDEVVYHPDNYKTQLCAGGGKCFGFYCPHAHSELELKGARGSTAAAGRATRGQKMRPRCQVIECPSRAGDAIEAVMPQQVTSTAPMWWSAGDRDDLKVLRNHNLRDECVDALVGGSLHKGCLLKGNAWDPCQVKLMHISRSDTTIASQVVKSWKRWTSRLASGSPFLLRRTVATAALAFPIRKALLEMRRTDTSTDKGRILVKAIPQKQARPLFQSFTKVMEQVEALHSNKTCHLCIGPTNIWVDESTGSLQIGDFLGKIRLLASASSDLEAFSEYLGDSAMWFPQEVLCGTMDGGSAGIYLLDADTMEQVDVWQLGVTAFFLLTGAHPFGNLETMSVESFKENIMEGRKVNWHLLGEGVNADLLNHMLERSPEERPRLQEVLRAGLLRPQPVATPEARLTAQGQKSSGAGISRAAAAKPPGLEHIEPLPLVHRQLAAHHDMMSSVIDNDDNDHDNLQLQEKEKYGAELEEGIIDDKLFEDGAACLPRDVWSAILGDASALRKFPVALSRGKSIYYV
eukprot:CAMPEP_0178391656 /NCGR_PEP_ID=MMETSP0689_2-20121128/11276_1 /TAXON_ID=160604 /ORGANISM="Amphidinium massartii, Strain CS-259" /LENGTH=568 /DNA_ID=CAMNT_0020012207 /DNA_START=136 /DNA_END=1842 /DNA_ORIENTATION=-